MRHAAGNSLPALHAIAALMASLCAVAPGHADLHQFVSPNAENFGSFGSAVAGLHDVNGDGWGDVVIGADNEDGAGILDSGRVYVFSGATGALIRSHNSPNAESQGFFGQAVAGIPDVNGDGRDDYIVGAPEENGGGVNGAGRVYVFSGATGGLIRVHNSPNPESFGRFGTSVAGIPDINGDGRGDYIVGAYDENGGGVNGSGRVYVYSGATGALIRTHTSPNAVIGGSFGDAVAGIPDATGDGRGDYVIGAPYEDIGATLEAGRAYIYNGSTGALTHVLVSPNPENSGRFGNSVGGLHDANGNGLGEVVVGAAREDPGASPLEAGRAYLFNGTTGGLLLTLKSPNETSGGYFGASVAGVDDRDGDGLGDVAVGAEFEGDGRGYVFSGATGTLIASLAPSLSSPAQLGNAIAGVPDCNGDGRGDTIIGGLTGEVSGGPPNAGLAYLERFIPNDGCSVFSVLNLPVGSTPFTTIGATEGPSDPGCQQFVDPGPDIWYAHTAACNGTMTVSTCGTADYDTKIAVYDGCSYSLFVCNLGPPIACNDDFPGCAGFTSKVTVPVTSGDCFFVRIGGFQGAAGTGTINVSYNCPCLGDLNGDNKIDAADLGSLLGQWGTNGSADLNADNVVNAADLAILLGAWGPC
ncbi:MAG: FG-GAP-like repeat-containing protein [Phycisphaerales bacterium]